MFAFCDKYFSRKGANRLISPKSKLAKVFFKLSLASLRLGESAGADRFRFGRVMVMSPNFYPAGAIAPAP
jgi:hypothetical protein